MPNLQRLDRKIQRGYGRVAKKAGGQTYTVYRLTAASNGSLLDVRPIVTGFQMKVGKAKASQIENPTWNLNVYVGDCDNQVLQLGDVLVETGFESAAGDVFIFAQRRPSRSNLFVRAESNISITRPQPRGGQSGQQPVSGSVAAPGYIGADKRGEWGLQLVNGRYSFTNDPGATLSAVPAGLTQATRRLRDGHDPKIPVSLYREEFIVYLPLLPGIQLQELDRVNFPNSDRYQLGSIYTSEQTGLGGYIIVGEKLGT